MPNALSQRSLIRHVIHEAGIEPQQIAYVEAHGTGTQAGDPIEATSLGLELCSGRPPGNDLWIGSIKTNIGHLEAGAGVAGLIKAALVLQNRTVPPNLHFKNPNPRIDFPGLRLRVPIRPEPLHRDGPVSKPSRKDNSSVPISCRTR